MMFRQNPNGRSAIVIGGSICGLLAARVLADHFETVIILERDFLLETTEHRASVPHSHHIHLLLARGGQLLESLFPGFGEALTELGAVPFDFAADTRVWLRGRWLAPFRSGILGRGCSRILLEQQIRRWVAMLSNVRFVSGVVVKGLILDMSETAVCGVRLNWRENPAGPTVMHANCVVDASGRNGKTAFWLTQLGYQPPQETVIDARLGYATRRVQLSNRVDWKMLTVLTHPPHKPRGGVLLQEEDGNWVATLTGANGDYPPTTNAAFLAFAASLEPELAQALAAAQPLTPIRGYRRTTNCWRHFEKLLRWPDNFAVVGDAVCALNPIYAQGMTAGGLGVLALGRELERNGRGNGRFFTHKTQKEIGYTMAPAWLLATSEDSRWPTTTNGAVNGITRLAHWYFDQLANICADDPFLLQEILQVQQLLKPPIALLRWQVMRRLIGRFRPTRPLAQK